MTHHPQIPTITYQTAARAVALAIEEGAKVGVRVSVTVVDPSLALVAYGRADGTTPQSVETSRRKANTGASMRRPSAVMPAEGAVSLEHATGGLLTSVAGGVPLGFDGVHTGHDVVLLREESAASVQAGCRRAMWGGGQWVAGVRLAATGELQVLLEQS